MLEWGPGEAQSLHPLNKWHDGRIGQASHSFFGEHRSGNYPSLPTILTQLFILPFSFTNILPPKTRCSWETCNQSFYVSPKGLVHAHSGFTQVLISIYCLMYWKANAHPHKSSQCYCAVPHACIYNVTYKREMRAFPCFHWASEDNKGQSEQLVNLKWLWGIITRLHSNELFSWNLLLCLLHKVQRKVYLQIGAETFVSFKQGSHVPRQMDGWDSCWSKLLIATMTEGRGYFFMKVAFK